MCASPCVATCDNGVFLTSQAGTTIIRSAKLFEVARCQSPHQHQQYFLPPPISSWQCHLQTLFNASNTFGLHLSAAGNFNSSKCGSVARTPTLSAGSGLAAPAALTSTELAAVGCTKSHPPLAVAAAVICVAHASRRASHGRRPAATHCRLNGRRRLCHRMCADVTSRRPTIPHRGPACPGSPTTATDGVGVGAGGVRLDL